MPKKRTTTCIDAAILKGLIPVAASRERQNGDKIYVFCLMQHSGSMTAASSTTYENVSPTHSSGMG